MNDSVIKLYYRQLNSPRNSTLTFFGWCTKQTVERGKKGNTFA